MPKAADITGERFGRLVDVGRLRCGTTRSCGCLKLEMTICRSTVHGRCGSRLYEIWSRMKQRCHNSECSDYKYYGARGVQVCQRWRDSFADFRADVSEPAPGMTLDRWPNNNGNYEPGNVRWASRAQQGVNTRRNVWIEHDGKRLTISQWARHWDVNPSAISGRTAKGMTPEQAVTVPFRRVT